MNQSEKKVLQALLDHPGGLTMAELHRLAKTASLRYTQQALERLFGVYIDRWQWSDKYEEYQAVYCLADVPEDCPRP